MRATVQALSDLGVRVHCLALGGVDLASAAGKMTMGVIAAVAEQTWSGGRGRKPGWVTEALAAGKSLSDFEIS